MVGSRHGRLYAHRLDHGGSYQQDIGLAQSEGYRRALQPIPHERRAQQAGDSDKHRYAFNDPLLWHRVLPSDGKPVTTLMLTYKPEDWRQVGPKPPYRQRTLTEDERRFMLVHFMEIL